MSADERRALLGELLSAAGTFAAFRAVLFAFQYLGLTLLPRIGTCRPQWEVFGAGHEFWNGFFRWDGGWYRSIVLNGYTYRGPEHPSSVAFYPLYPYLCRWLGHLVGSPFVSALIISASSTVVGIFFMRRLGALLLTRDATDRAVTYLLVFPTSFFLTAFYTEGLFFALAAGSIYFFLKERYVTSGVLGAFSVLARSSGMSLFVALAVDLGIRLSRRKLRFRWSMLGVLIVPAGLAAFMAILNAQVGDPLAFSKVMGNWHRDRAFPWVPLVNTLRHLSGGFPATFEATQELLDAIFAVAFLGIGGAMIRRRYPIVLSAFVLVGVLVPLATGNLTSMTRYVVVLFPAFFWVADTTAKKPMVDRLILLGSTLLLAVFSMRFMRCAWAG